MQALIFQANLHISALKEAFGRLASEENTTRIGVGLDHLAGLFAKTSDK